MAMYATHCIRVGGTLQFGTHQVGPRCFSGTRGSHSQNSTHIVGRDNSPGHQRNKGQSDGGRVTARCGKSRGLVDQLARRRSVQSRKLRHRIGEGGPVGSPVKGVPVRRVLQPTIRPQVHQDFLSTIGEKGLSELSGIPVGKRHHDNIVAGQHLEGGLLENLPVK